MSRILFIIFLITLLLCVEIKGKLYGEDLEDAVDILDNALSQLRKKDGPYFTLRGVQAAYKFARHIIYTFDAQLLDPKGKLDYCVVEYSVDVIQRQTSLVAITCGGVEKHRQLLTQKIPFDDI